jgi:nucleotide-binding universal stress UspA family protein
MYKHILAPIDGSEKYARALHVALLLAREYGAELKPIM